MTCRTAVAVAVSLLILGGCSTADDQAGTTATVVPEATSEQPVALGDEALLEPSEMPAWNEAGVWVVIDDTEVLRACTLPTADSLGALAVLTRTFENEFTYAEDETPDPDAPPMLGINQVAAWADDTAAADAVETWTAALDECSNGQGQIATVEGGSTWIVATRDESSMNESWFDIVGVAAKGSTTTLVGFSLWGQDANYEGDPLGEAMQASLDRLP